VHRVLRPGGLFIVREHSLDAAGYLLPMLDCAHLVRQTHVLAVSDTLSSSSALVIIHSHRRFAGLQRGYGSFDAE
jgi:hypothetical protein